ncbi:MAG: hypothetical protein K1000chlam2_01827 [Chlamydiae bacterium]|nr:hypothetical protein [Chlamydiota bacterium]
MLGLLAIILIHSSPFDEIAQGSTGAAPPQQQMEPQPLNLPSGETIQISQFLFTGNTAIPTSQLQRLTNPYLNKALSASEISLIEQRIQSLYSSIGYPNASAVVTGSPTSDTVTVIIKEGKKSS